jgi:hypothetical protein
LATVVGVNAANGSATFTTTGSAGAGAGETPPTVFSIKRGLKRIFGKGGSGAGPAGDAGAAAVAEAAGSVGTAAGLAGATGTTGGGSPGEDVSAGELPSAARKRGFSRKAGGGVVCSSLMHGHHLGIRAPAK